MARKFRFKTTSCLLVTAATVFGVLQGKSAFGQDCMPDEIQKIRPVTVEADNQFGYSIAIDGNVAMVGELRDEGSLSDIGSVSYYLRAGGLWVFRQRLYSPLPSPSNGFGFSVDTENFVLVVGEPYGDTLAGVDAGRAHVYRHDGFEFVYETMLEAPDGHSLALFGNSVAIAKYLNTERIAIGARDDDEMGNEAGAVYIYRRDSGVWTFERKITANDAAAGDRFGWSVSLDGRYLGIGAPGNDDDGEASGSAYVYELFGTAWIRRATLTADDGAETDNFGFDVAINDVGTIVVGAPLEDELGGNAGAAYVYRRNVASWPEEAKLFGSDEQAIDNFGRSVAIEGDGIIVGSPQHDIPLGSCGAAYSFEYNGLGWTEVAKLTATDVAVGDRIGFDVSFDGETAFVSAAESDELALNAGGAYFFPANCPPTIGDMNCDGVVDMLDVAPFAVALTDAPAYQSQYPSCDPLAGDFDGNEMVDGADIHGFVTALMGQ